MKPDVRRQNKEGNPDQPLRPPFRRFVLVPFALLPQSPNQDPAGEKLDDAVQAESDQGDASYPSAGPEGNHNLNQVPRQPD